MLLHNAERTMAMTLLPWSHPCSAGFTLRGWHSEPTGKPLLHFMHGNGFCGRTYEPMLAVLSDYFDLWLSDVQGHGSSDVGRRFIGWNQSAELAVEAFELKRLLFGDVPCVAVGHSFGGVLTGLMLAEHPTLFQRAVLLDPVLFSPTMIGIMALSDVVGLYRRNRLAGRARRRRRQWPDREAAMASLQGRGMFAGWDEAALGAYVNHALRDGAAGGVELCCPPEREAEIFSSFPRKLWPALAKVKTPTQVIVGEHSYPFVAKAVTRWRTRNDHVSHVTMRGGHCFMQQYPEQTALGIANFLLEKSVAAIGPRA
jgi:pimeloyl-ACP methyl ester carboxylesterase